jgi:hypothetical protein
VVVRVHDLVRPFGFSEDLAGAVREYLVRVHVVRRAGAGLIHVHDELIAERAGQDLVRRLDDGVGDGVVEAPQRGVGARACLLDQDRRRDERRGCRQSADREVLDRTLGLDAVVGVGRHAQLAKRIALNPRRHLRSIILAGCLPLSSTAWCS